jgi:putative tryptophan/tyrosine transport system substrate-binding protein
MKRILTWSVAATFFCFAANAQERAPVRIGILCAVECAGPALEAFWQELNALGYSRGRNLIVDERAAYGAYDVLPRFSSELIALNPNVIVAVGNPTGLAAQRLTKSIPIVLAMSGNADQLGLVKSLARPDGNITGITILHSDLEPKRLEMLSETTIGLSRVAVLSNPNNPSHMTSFADTAAAGHSRGLVVERVDVRSPEELEAAFTRIKASGAGAVLVQSDPMLESARETIAALALSNHLTSIHMSKPFAQVGGLMTYGPDYVSMFRRAAHFVDKILRGSKPGDLPVEQPTKFELVVNLTTARALGITVPPSILSRADEVIE